MVGDGANDLMALRESDIGFGMSETDASYASSFSITELMDIDQIIRQAKNTSINIVETLRYYGIINFLKIPSSLLMMT